MTSLECQLSASIICADMLRLREEILLLEKGGIDAIHFDVMDGIFVPRYGLHPEVLAAIHSISSIPIDVHMMVENAETFIDVFSKTGARSMTVHAESHRHLHRTITLIKKTGLKVGVALNPGTPLEVLDYVLEDIDIVLIMAINPGIVGHGLIPGSYEKIGHLRKKIGSRNIIIEVDGGVTPQSAPEMIRRGANRLVCGTGTIFRPHESPVDVKLKEFKNILDAL